MRGYLLLSIFAWISISSVSASYPRKVFASECIDLFTQGASISYTVNISGCTVKKQSTPPIKTYSFGEDVLHGYYVEYGPEYNLTFWRKRYVDNRDVKRMGPVARQTGVAMDATGYAYIFMEDYDPKTHDKLAFLHMECRGDNGGFTTYAQTPAGKLLDFTDIKTQLWGGALLFYSVYSSRCEPSPQNLTHTVSEAGPLDEYRFDPKGDLTFTYRVGRPNLSLEIVTIKMTSSTAATMERYTYSEITGKSGPLVTKTCDYGDRKAVGIYRVSSPQQ